MIYCTAVLHCRWPCARADAYYYMKIRWSSPSMSSFVVVICAATCTQAFLIMLVNTLNAAPLHVHSNGHTLVCLLSAVHRDQQHVICCCCFLSFLFCILAFNVCNYQQISLLLFCSKCTVADGETIGGHIDWIPVNARAISIYSALICTCAQFSWWLQSGLRTCLLVAKIQLSRPLRMCMYKIRHRPSAIGSRIESFGPMPID